MLKNLASNFKWTADIFTTFKLELTLDGVSSLNKKKRNALEKYFFEH